MFASCVRQMQTMLNGPKRQPQISASATWNEKNFQKTYVTNNEIVITSQSKQFSPRCDIWTGELFNYSSPLSPYSRTKKKGVGVGG